MTAVRMGVVMGLWYDGCGGAGEGQDRGLYPSVEMTALWGRGGGRVRRSV
jgi:hypothetical protein